MKIVKIDERGRISLKKIINHSYKIEYYKLEYLPMGKLLLTPITDEIDIKNLDKLEDKKEDNEYLVQYRKIETNNLY